MRAMPRPAPRVAPATTATCPVSGGDGMPGTINERTFINQAESERPFIMLAPMSPRPRAIADADILTATHRAVTRVGPMRLTLADVAREAGVSPATLVQRFGSKRQLLLALVASGSGDVEAQWAPIRAVAERSPLEAIYAYGECFAGMAPTPEVL